MGVTINGSNFGGGTIEAGQTASGAGTITATTNDGLLEVTANGSLEITGALSGSGVAEIGDGGTLHVDGGLNGGNVVFDPSAHRQTLIVGQGTSAATLVANTGNGVLEITQSGSSAALGSGSPVLDLGQFANQGGILSVGGNSSFTETGEIIAGDAGTGSLAVGSGSTLQIATSGSIALDFGEQAASSGQASITGGRLSAGTNNVVVGDLGAGAMTIAAAGTLAGTVVAGTGNGDLPAVDIGEQAGGSGTVVVSGTGSSLLASGQVDVGDGGMGALVVEQGGTVQSGGNTLQPGGGFSVGFDSGGVGEVTVTGTTSALHNVGQFTVGGDTATRITSSDLGAGIGTLRILNGATVTTNPGSGYTGPAADIAAGEDAAGSSVTVTGTNSTWNIGGTLVVGDAAAGSLGVSAGGTVDAANLVIGDQSGASGDVSVNGTTNATTILNISSNIAVGGQSAGYLHLNNGASLQAQNITVGGSTATGIGELDAESGSTITVAGTLTVGGTGGAGVLILGSNVNGSAAVLRIAANGIENDISDPFNTGTTYNDGIANKSGTVTDTDTILANSGTFVIEPGADYTLNAHTITHDGTYSVHNGLFQLEDGATFNLNAGTIDNSQTIEFDNSSSLAQLNIGTISGFRALIGSFDANAEITVVGSTIASVAPITSGGTTVALDLYDSGSHLIGQLNVASSMTPTELSELETVNADGGLGAMPCFAEGTLIRTTRGDVPVEELREGDLAPTELAGEAAPVVWIGRRTVECARHREPRRVWPVRVQAGAFGPGRPTRDLWLSPDHAVFFEGVLIPVKYLINDAAIVQVRMDRITYYHVELPRHDVILAEGLATESFLDTGGKCMFENGGAAMVLHPDFSVLVWEAEGCAPLVVTGPEVVAARRRLAKAA